MSKRNYSKYLKMVLILAIVLTILIARINTSSAAPGGVNVSYNFTQTATPAPAAAITTAGGTFTTLVFNTTTQTLRWKAYAGNISGKLTLDDGANYTIYDWSMTIVAGEVFASRSNSINWANINCSNRTNVYGEENNMNLSALNDDSINKTFQKTIHKQFIVGDVLIRNSTCPAIATYINDTSQPAAENATFQEILLNDGTNMVYSTLLEPNSTGFNTQKFNFQMIVPEKGVPGPATSYYFYAELG